jgi:hypothetical protein
MRDIVIYTSFFNEIESLPRLINNLKSYGLKGIFVDGVYPTFPHTSTQSTDGSRELIHNEGMILLDAGLSTRAKKFNLYVKKAIELGYKHILVVDADEWLEGNLDDFLKLIDTSYPINNIMQRLEEVSKYSIAFGIRPDQKERSRPRVLVDINNLLMKDVHWLYWHNGKAIPHTENYPTIPYLKIRQDESLRSGERNEIMEDYHFKQRERESILIEYYRSKSDPKHGTPDKRTTPIINNIHSRGDATFACGCTHRSGLWYNVCIHHQKQIFG